MRDWTMARDGELIARITWLEGELSLVLALLKLRDQGATAGTLIARIETVARAGPDDPEWQGRYDPVH